MYRNRLENSIKFPTGKYILINLFIVLQSSLKVVANKSNYMEYYLGMKQSYEARIKGTSWVFFSEGTIERRKVLFMSFETWLYFFSITNVALHTDTWQLCDFYNLVIFLKMWL
ncbi:hypothetical protein CPG37_04520 [Malaciobacter canalis]|uniref:Uncharacterized protein n=1 Tax=Malaciobacter canalis TaxID=1912871 RepID=A0ABX4LQU3_9BACT|nr:hypothetical protein [Malaciobacter canalis]PHO10316.1 hypothetical protein CPG37_04520 [Malaciobacter canalis]QEE32421.1 hypothetical protein ACAN_0932 [Malaciobacter canalis]